MAVKSLCPEIDFTKMPSHRFGGTAAGRRALKVAIDELNSGSKEIGGINRGEWVKKYLNGMAPEGSAWCAAFVSYCFKESRQQMPFRYTISARELLNQFRQKNWSFEKGGNVIPEPGDIVVWWRGSRNGWQGHTGIVHHCENGFLFTIEGNRTAKVEGFCYKLKGMRKVLGFGRVPGEFVNIKT